MARRKFHTAAAEFLYNRYIAGDPEREAMYEEEVINADIARKIYQLRTKAGLTQQQLAARVGTSKSAICRLEDADYEGHSLSMLKRIAEALGKRVEIRFVTVKEKKRKPDFAKWRGRAKENFGAMGNPSVDEYIEEIRGR